MKFSKGDKAILENVPRTDSILKNGWELTITRVNKESNLGFQQTSKGAYLCTFKERYSQHFHDYNGRDKTSQSFWIGAEYLDQIATPLSFKNPSWEM